MTYAHDNLASDELRQRIKQHQPDWPDDVIDTMVRRRDEEEVRAAIAVAIGER